MKRKILSLMLAAALTLGLAAPALAAGQTFTDVPSSYWGYTDIEAVAEAGLMNGTGGGAFSPEMKVSVAQFLTLLGRLVFPDVKAEGADWYGPYVAAAQEAKLLDGTQVDTNNVEAEISRYDMAVILRAAAKKLGVAEKVAQSSEVKDYLDIPTRYADSVLAVYGMGLIKGDQAGNFNGSNTMMRAEVATVIMRLKKATGNQGSTTTDPGTEPGPTEPEKPDETAETTEEYLSGSEEGLETYTFGGYLVKTDHDIGRPAYDKHTYHFPDVPYKVYYTADGGKTSSLIAEGRTGNDQTGDPSSYGYPAGHIEFDVQLPKDAFSSPKHWGQQGVYISAETELDGQKLVTSDLRTDGRAFVSLVQPRIGFGIQLTPPTGEKAKFTIKGGVVYGLGGTSKVGEGFTVQLHLKDGRVVAETATDANGEFFLECAIDALDNGFDADIEQYYLTASGIQNGIPMEKAAWSPTSTQRLRSLNSLGGNPNNNTNTGTYMAITVHEK